MKRLLYALGVLAVAAITAISCNKEQSIDEPDFYEYTFIVGNADAVNANADTRALLGSDENGLFLTWESTDELNSWALVNNNNYSYNNTSTIDVSTNPVTFKIKSYQLLDAGATIYASYPYESTNSQTPVASLSIPSAQSQNGTSFDASAMPMVAKPFPVSNAITTQSGTSDEAEAVEFYNLGGIIEFDIYSPSGTWASESITSVTFEADKKIAGDFTFDLRSISNEASLSIADKDYEETSIVTNVENLTVGESAVDASTAKKVYMVVAPGEYTGTVTVMTNAAKYEYVITTAKTIDRASVKRLGINLEKQDARTEKGCVKLPWESAAEGEGVGKNTLNDVDGVDVTADSDYSTGPNFIKFSGDTHNIIIKTDSQIGVVSVDVKANGSPSTSIIYISSSADKLVWSEVEHFTLATGVITTTKAFAPTARYVKIWFDKQSGNAGIGRIAISKASTDPVIVADDISDVPATGVTNAESTYTALNFVNDVVVPSEGGFTGCVTGASIVEGKIQYSVAPNYTTEEQTGTIKIWSAADYNVSKTISVTQAASVFTASSTNALAFDWDANTKHTTKTVTITSTFALAAANVELSGTNADKFTATIVRDGETDDYTLSVAANEDNDGESDYSATVTVSRNNLTIPIAITQAYDTGVMESEYKFTSSGWNATLNNEVANWTSGKNGAGFNNNGIQVTQNTNDANGTSPISFSNITKIVCTYNTNQSQGAGSIKAQIGNNTEISNNVSYTGSADGRSAMFTTVFNYATPQSGKVKLTVHTTTNSIYLVSVAITSSSHTATYSVNVTDDDYGTVTASPNSNVAEGTPVTLNIVPNENCTLTSLTVDGTNVTSSVTNNSYQFSMPDHDVAVVASFKQLATSLLTLSALPSDQSTAGCSYSVEVEGDSSPLTSNTTVLEGKTITVGYTAGTGYTFSSWDIYKTDDPTTKVTVTNNTFTMPAYPVTVSATFAADTKKTYTLTITSDDLKVLDSSQSSGYDKYKGDQTFTAVATDNSEMEVTVNIADVMPATGTNAGKLQIKKSTGVLYNKTNLGSISSISAGSLTQTIGDSQNPGSASANGGYFKLVNSTNGAVYLDSITITFSN